MAKTETHLKIVKHNGTVHIVPDNRHSREFHVRYTKFAQPGDRYKLIQIVSGSFKLDKATGASEFEEAEVIEELYSNLSPAEGKAVAIEEENETLKAQIEALKKKLRAAKKGEAGAASDDQQTDLDANQE